MYSMIGYRLHWQRVSTSLEARWWKNDQHWAAEHLYIYPIWLFSYGQFWVCNVVYLQWKLTNLLICYLFLLNAKVSLIVKLVTNPAPHWKVFQWTRNSKVYFQEHTTYRVNKGKLIFPKYPNCCDHYSHHKNQCNMALRMYLQPKGLNLCDLELVICLYATKRKCEYRLSNVAISYF